MRRLGVIGLLCGGALLGAPAVALADKEIQSATPNRYSTTTPSIDQGERLILRNTDFARHDVTSTATGDVKGRLFASDTIGQNETSVVEGTQYLTTGAYEFFCTIHPDQMRGTLSVTGNGTPVPRPGTTPPPGGGGSEPPPDDITGPEIDLRTSASKARKLRRAGALPLRVGVDEGANMTVTVKVGKRIAARRKLSFVSAGTRRLDLRIARKVRKRLRRGQRLTIRATGTDKAGNPGVSTLRLRLR